MKWLFLMAVMAQTTAVLASTRQLSTTFSFDQDDFSFTEILVNGQTVRVDYAVTALPRPALNDSMLKFNEVVECAHWASSGTGPDDPGVCDEYRNTGKWTVGSIVERAPLFSVTQTVTDLTTGKRATKKLPDVTLLLVSTSTTRFDAPAIPAGKKLEFAGIIGSQIPFGCGNKEPFVTGAVVEDVPVNLGLCATFTGKKMKVTRLNGEYKATFSDELTLELDVYAYWLLQNFPSQELSARSLWEIAPKKTLILK